MWIPYGKQYIDQKDIDAVVKTLQSDFLTTGPKVKELENKICNYIWCKYSVVVWNCTQALHLAYLTIDLQEWDEVITTPNTFVATSNMLLVCRAKPVFCDINTETYNIDVDKIESLITEKTKAIAPVHFAGHPCEMDKIFEIAKKYKLKIIEDGAHAFGAEYKWKKIWNLDSDMSCFSFHPVKPFTTGEWWAVVTNNEAYYKKLLKLRSHGIEKDENWFNVMVDIWYNFRMTDIQATLGISQLSKLDDFLGRRKKVVWRYNELFWNIDSLQLPTEKENISSGWHLYVVRFQNKEVRDRVMDVLRKNNYGVTLHYPPVYSHPYYRNNWFKDFTLEKVEHYYDTCLSLPIFYGLDKWEIENIVNLITKNL